MFHVKRAMLEGVPGFHMERWTRGQRFSCSTWNGAVRPWVSPCLAGFEFRRVHIESSFGIAVRSMNGLIETERTRRCERSSRLASSDRVSHGTASHETTHPKHEGYLLVSRGTIARGYRAVSNVRGRDCRGSLTVSRGAVIKHKRYWLVSRETSERGRRQTPDDVTVETVRSFHVEQRVRAVCILSKERCKGGATAT